MDKDFIQQFMAVHLNQSTDNTQKEKEEEEEEEFYLQRDVYLRLNAYDMRQYAQLDHIYYHPARHHQMSMDPGV